MLYLLKTAFRCRGSKRQGSEQVQTYDAPPITKAPPRFPKTYAIAAGVLSAAIAFVVLPIVFLETMKFVSAQFLGDPNGAGIGDMIGFFLWPILLAIDMSASIGIGMFVGLRVCRRLQR